VSVQHTQMGNLVEVTISGSFNERTLTRDLLAAIFKVLAQESEPQLVFNLGEVDSINSMAIGKLVEIKRRVEAEQGVFGLVNVPGQILNVFRMARLQRHLNCHESLQAFQRAYSGTPQTGKDFEIETVGERLQVHLSRWFSGESDPTLASEVTGALGGEIKSVYINLRHMPTIRNELIGQILTCYREAQGKELQFALVNVSGECSATLRAMKLNLFFPMHDDAADLIDTSAGGEGKPAEQSAKGGGEKTDGE
jgi:anti-anti-sigma factor